MPALKLLAKLALYYAVMAAFIVLVLWVYPPLQDNLPIGRVQGLLAEAGDLQTPLTGIAKVPQGNGPLGHVPSFAGSLIWLGAAMLGALFASFPVSHVYMSVRSTEDYDQSLVDTILVLPLVVTSIVVIVQHSLALAFSLAGIAGAARFRNTLRSSGDLLFILLAIGIGLSAGIGAVELAILTSATFNLVFVMLWFTSYGERDNMKRFLGEIGPTNGTPAPVRVPKPKIKPPTAEGGEAEAEPGARKMKQTDFKGL
jgi:hypothetical protein